MEETSILAKFDDLVKSHVVLFDENQAVVSHRDGSLEFHFIVSPALTEKPLAPQQPQDHNPQAGSDIDTTGFVIGHMATHLLVANKFAYGRPHLLLMTRDGFRRQFEPLDQEDINAVWAALTDKLSQDYVAFYNCGRDAGCSRLHKHMQLMPKPAHSFADFLDADGVDGVRAPEVPFRWFYERLDAESMGADEVKNVYEGLLSQAVHVGHALAEHAGAAPEGAACPHNVILTRQWIIVIPRRKAAMENAGGANALGMLGVIAVVTEQEVDNWVRVGLTKALGELGVPE